VIKFRRLIRLSIAVRLIESIFIQQRYIVQCYELHVKSFNNMKELFKSFKDVFVIAFN